MDKVVSPSKRVSAGKHVMFLVVWMASFAILGMLASHLFTSTGIVQFG